MFSCSICNINFDSPSKKTSHIKSNHQSVVNAKYRNYETMEFGNHFIRIFNIQKKFQLEEMRMDHSFALDAKKNFQILQRF